MALANRQRIEPGQKEFHAAISRAADAWYAACLRLTRDETLAQDAVQDALLQAWSKRRQFQGTSRLETWIHRIAVNSSLSLLRRQRPAALVPVEQMPGADPSPVEACAEQELGRDLEAALRKLSEMERICFVLKHLEQWRLAEIANELGTGVGPVKQALFRALTKLRASMAPRRSTT